MRFPILSAHPVTAGNTRTLPLMADMLRQQADLLDQDGDSWTANAARARAGRLTLEAAVASIRSGATVIGSAGHA
ncbi:hypothetical protein FW320_06485 [Azospirillum sp. Vi22]|uniref:hypothetical protein n=1 Tax=Azospirillum baldaniorum TaxID=1064539 RepID=UPI00157AEE62|nr:hypothetical protein [Azospirillum baldaniorum]NUB05822.1 hypothetical protein [Azospirillum baldaniorum]